MILLERFKRERSLLKHIRGNLVAKQIGKFKRQPSDEALLSQLLTILLGHRWRSDLSAEQRLAASALKTIFSYQFIIIDSIFSTLLIIRAAGLLTSDQGREDFNALVQSDGQYAGHIGKTLRIILYLGGWVEDRAQVRLKFNVIFSPKQSFE